MAYPTLEQYNEVFQHPSTALTDSVLKTATVVTTGLGLPLALCGGFALTYTLKVGGAKYAVRCFHKHSDSLEKRYSAISKRLRALNSSYFVEFEFQPQGVAVLGKRFPVVKMAWAKGTTLGEFLEQKYQSPNEINNLLSSLKDLASYLELQNLAHGDISPDNLMVSDGGKTLQLIDYDGMYVEELKSLGSAELGNRNFQHPKRIATNFDRTLDRFSFIQLSLALQVLIDYPSLWRSTQSDASAILFRANDFSEPSSSSIFLDLFQKSQFLETTKNFAAICKAPFDQIPSLDDFLQKKNIPQIAVSVVRQAPSILNQYLSAFPVLDASNYLNCLNRVGDKVELIGQITEIKRDKARNGKPYVFINFGSWKGKIVKICIWSEGLEALTTPPDESWVGKWVSVVGLMEPPYISQKYKYSHLAISITQSNQIHVISDKDARYRLAGSVTRSTGNSSRGANQDILDSIKGKTGIHTTSTVPTPSRTKNKDILNAIHQNHQGSTSLPKTVPHKSHSQTGQTYQTPRKTNSNCFIATAVYGHDAFETEALRRWRDDHLLPSFTGRLFVKFYYRISPYLVPYIKKNARLRIYIKSLLDRFIRYID